MKTKKLSAVFITLSLLLQMFAFSVSASEVQQKQNGLSNSLWKLKNGDTFTVGYLGGSITQGVGHKTSNGYANLSFNALKEKYSREGLTFKKLQKGISGTGSNYGAYRIDAEFSLQDPSKVPDLAFIEFSINDNHQGFSAANSRKYMETIARKLYTANPNMDVVFLYTTQITRLDNIDTWITAHKAVADRYGITQINVGKALIDHIRAHEDYVSDEVTFAGSTTDKNYSDLWLTYMSDYVHPSDNGYQVYSDAIMAVLNEEWSKEVPDTQTPMVLSESAYGSVDEAYLAGIPNTYSPAGNQIPGTNQTYEISYIDNTSTTALWQTNTKRLDINGADQVIGFKFTGTGLSFRYRANLYNYGSLKFNIDGKVYMLPAVSSRDWFINVADNLPYGEHTVTILSDETTKGPNNALYIYGFGIIGDPDHKGITLIDAGSSLNPISAILSADKDKISEEEELTVTASVDCKNPIMDVSFYVNDVLYKGTVTQDSTGFSTKMSGLVVGKNVIKAVVRDSFNKVETNTIEVTSVTKNSVIVPSVLIAAGTAVSSTNYTGERIDIAGAGYNKPLPPKRGLFMKVDMPEIPEGYDIKKVTMLSSIFFEGQFSSGQSGKNLYFYPLSENIESDYKYKADTVSNPSKNLATLLTAESVSTANAPIKYTGGENYSEYVTTGNSKYNYNLYTDVTKFFKNSIYNEEKSEVTKSFAACYAWDNGITFRASTATEIANPIVFLLELEELLDAKFINDSTITADEAFNLELKVNKDSISGVSFNINGSDYIAEKAANGNWTARIEGLPSGTYTATATVTDADGTTLTKNTEITAKIVINKTCVITPEVLLLAGTATENSDYTHARMDILGAGYNKPLPPKRGLFMKVNMPQIAENYEIEKVTMLSSIYFDNHFSSGQSGKNLFFYPLYENIDSTYKYKADTENNPNKNLATLLTTESVSTANAPVKYTGGENYSEYATTGNSKYNYNLYTDVTKFFKNTIYNGEKDEVTKSFAASYAWDNGITFRASTATELKNPIVFLVEVSQLINAEFVSDNFAHTNEGFGVAVKIDSDNISNVSFDINGESYTAELNANGEWATFIEAGLPDGNYEITASITDNNGKKATVNQSFYVTPNYKFINPVYSVKLQESDGKMWTVGNANNYNLKYQNGTYKEVLYSAVNISSLTNADIIDKVYLATSTASNSQLGGSNSWTQFRFDACSEVSSSTLPGGKVPAALPEIGEKIAEDMFTTYSLKSGMADYKLFADNITVSSNTTANYMKINVTDYVKSLINSGNKVMYFRTAVSPTSGQTYSFALNNTNVKLLVKFKSPSVIDNHNGTTSYVITPSDYNADSVNVITATYTNNALTSVTTNQTITDRTLFTFKNGEPAKIYIWENWSTMKPLDKAIIVQ